MGLGHWFKTSSGPVSCNLIYVAKPCLCPWASVERSWLSPADLDAGGRRTQACKHWRLIIGFAHVLVSVPSSRSRRCVTPLNKHNLLSDCTEEQESVLAPAVPLARWEPRRDSCSGQQSLEQLKPALQTWSRDHVSAEL